MTTPTPTVDLDLDRLESAARAAMKGPWKIRGPTRVYGNIQGDQNSTGDAVGSAYAPEDAAFIAAFNPATALSLISALRASEAERERLEAIIDQIESNLTDDEEPGEYNPTPVQRSADLWRSYKGIYASFRAGVDRVAELEGALHSAALNLAACAVAIRKGGKSNGRHILAEGWAEQADAALSRTRPSGGDAGQ